MLIGAYGCRLLRDERSVRNVEVTRSAPTSKREMGLEGALCLLDRLPFDLEGLVTATRQEAHRTPRGKRAIWSGDQLLTKQKSMLSKIENMLSFCIYLLLFRLRLRKNVGISSVSESAFV